MSSTNFHLANWYEILLEKSQTLSWNRELDKWGMNSLHWELWNADVILFFVSAGLAKDGANLCPGIIALCNLYILG